MHNWLKSPESILWQISFCLSGIKKSSSELSPVIVWRNISHSSPGVQREKRKRIQSRAVLVFSQDLPLISQSSMLRMTWIPYFLRCAATMVRHLDCMRDLADLFPDTFLCLSLWKDTYLLLKLWPWCLEWPVWALCLKDWGVNFSVRSNVDDDVSVESCSVECWMMQAWSSEGSSSLVLMDQMEPSWTAPESRTSALHLVSPWRKGQTKHLSGTWDSPRQNKQLCPSFKRKSPSHYG